MHPADINAAIRKANSTQAAIARSFAADDGRALSHAAVQMVISGRGKSGRIARRISEVTGIPAARLWPRMYPDLEAEQAVTPPPRPRRAR